MKTIAFHKHFFFIFLLGSCFLTGCTSRYEIKEKKLSEVLGKKSIDRMKGIEILKGQIGSDWDAKPHRGKAFIMRMIKMLHLAEQYRLSEKRTDAFNWFLRVRHLAQRGPLISAAKFGILLLHFQPKLGLDCSKNKTSTSCLGYLNDPEGWKSFLRELSIHPTGDALPTQNASRFLLLAEFAHIEGREQKASSFADKALSAARKDSSVTRSLCSRFGSLKISLSTTASSVCKVQS